MCVVPAMMGMLGGKVGGKVGALATGGLAGLAAHQLTKKKKTDPLAPPAAPSTSQSFYGAKPGGA